MSQLALDFPVRPRAHVEQTVVPLRTTNEEKYLRWRQSDAGAEIFAWVRERALEQALAQATRIGIKDLWEEARRYFKRSSNNTYTAFVARELVRTEPSLRELIELRERTAT